MDNDVFRDLNEITRFDDCYSEFKNGYRVYDKDVGKEAFKHLSIFDRLFRPDKVATKILVTHAIMCEQIQDLPDKES